MASKTGLAGNPQIGGISAWGTPEGRERAATLSVETPTRVLMADKLLGYRFRVCEVAPGVGVWENIRYMDQRDNIEDAQKIIDVLNETDINFTSYMIVAEPVYSKFKD